MNVIERQMYLTKLEEAQAALDRAKADRELLKVWFDGAAKATELWKERALEAEAERDERDQEAVHWAQEAHRARAERDAARQDLLRLDAVRAERDRYREAVAIARRALGCHGRTQAQCDGTCDDHGDDTCCGWR